MAAIQQQQIAKSNTDLKKFQEETVNQVLIKINSYKESGELKIPKDYSPENALKSAWLILLEAKDKNDKSVLEVCTQTSIANALLKMVVMGLSPMKKQCDFIAYGNQLICSPEYTGNIILAKRYGGLKWINANAIFEGDEFEFEIDGTTGIKRVLKHKQTLDSLGESKVKGAYAVYQLSDGRMNTEIMNMKQIQAAWNQGAMKGSSPAHRNFPDQQSIKTVINRACKLLIRGSDDSVLMYDDEDSDTPKSDAKMETVKQEIKDNANKQVISMDSEIQDIQHEEAKQIDTPKSELFTEDKPDF